MDMKTKFTILCEEFADYIKEANNGNKEHQKALADAYLLGDKLHRNRQKAMEYYRLLARDDDTRAQYMLGLIWSVFIINEKCDGVEMTENLKKASDKDFAPAIYLLGKYESDEKELFNKINTSAEMGFPPAIYKMGIFYKHGAWKESKDMTKAVEYFKKAADLGSIEALGVLCMNTTLKLK